MYVPVVLSLYTTFITNSVVEIKTIYAINNSNLVRFIVANKERVTVIVISLRLILD